jgi:RNA polymerase sigma-70 factor, ECF subfamily
VEQSGNITLHLENAAHGGDIEASALWVAVSDEIHDMAVALCRNETHQITIQPTALVNDVWLKLHEHGCGSVNWENRRHFFGSVSRALGQILIDYARARNRVKRGGTSRPTPLHLVPGELGTTDQLQDDSIQALSKALIQLGLTNERAEDVARMKYILGISTPVIAQILGVSTRTIRGDWRFAQAWLRRELSKKFGMEE